MRNRLILFGSAALAMGLLCLVMPPRRPARRSIDKLVSELPGKGFSNLLVIVLAESGAWQSVTVLNPSDGTAQVDSFLEEALTSPPRRNGRYDAPKARIPEGL